MPRNLSKLQIRAELLNAIKLLDSGDKHVPEFLNDTLAPLKDIENKDTILDILVKELIATPSEDRFYILSFLLESLIPKEKLEDELWNLLNLGSLTDATKANIINILKDIGNQISYEKYSEYFENPDAIVDSDTQKLLNNAISNPEALIDFLDFIEALPDTDRTILIDSLSEDYYGDELANLFTPVLYANPNSELCKYAIKRLGESKSTLAIRPINFILNFTKDEEIKSAAKKSLTALKLAGAREDSTDSFYAHAFGDSSVEDVFISMPDGKGNVGILLSRKKHDKNSLQMFAVVFNNYVGILDCFGFNDLTEAEFMRIVNNFYANQEKICISPAIAKKLLQIAEQTALTKIGKVSYEYVCWKRIFADVKEPEANIEELLEAKLQKQEITKADLLKIYDTAILDKWFFNNKDTESFNVLIEQVTGLLNENNRPTEQLNQIEKLITEYYSKIWNEEELSKIDFRLLLTAYLLYQNGFQTHANILNSIRYNKEVKEELLTNILKLSIYEFLLREREKHENKNITANIFSRRNEANKSAVGKKTLDLIITEIEEKWSKRD